MRRRTTTAAAWVFALFLPLTAPAQSPRPGDAASRPNIVLILADDQGYSDLGCFGSEIPTPRLDALAKEGVALTQFYNQARCCPTRAALLTGKYPHQVGVGAMIDEYAAWIRKAADSEHYQDHLADGVPTMADLLHDAGYRTLMSGKWHLGRDEPHWPVHRGFDRSFVQIKGAMNYFGGDSGTGPRDPMALDDKPFVPPHDGFYSTDAFTDHAIDFVTEAAGKKQPFFLYLPYNASHWPLQAPADEIAKFKGVYDAGWQAIREARLAKMKALGVVGPDQTMAPMDRGQARPWDKLEPNKRAEWARRMEVYAAQTAHMDTQIGRLLDTLKTLHVDGNTVVLFLSDNGGAAEDPNDRAHPGAVIGDRDSFRGYDRPWATVSNTPWRHHKVTAFEGGISTPLLVRFPTRPAGVPPFVRAPAGLLDLLPTLLDMAGATPPKDSEGRSILPMLHGAPGDTDRSFFWEHEGDRAVRHGDWKLVALPDRNDDAWQLFDLAHDRTESHDASAEHPELVTSLKAEYQKWADRVGVVPWSKIVAKRNAGEATGH